MISSPMYASASRCRTIGSSASPRSCAYATTLRYSSAKRSCWARNAVPRSNPSVAITTFQPWPIGPTTMSAGVRASEKNTSLNSAVPVIWVIGRSSTPGWSIGQRMKLIPSCFLVPVGVGAAHHEDPVGDVAEAGPHLLAVDDPLVAVEHGRGLHVGEVGAGVGLAEPLAPVLVGAQDRREEALLLLVGAEHHQRRPEQLLAEEAGAARPAGAGVLLVEDHLLGERADRGRRTASATRCPPSHRRRARAPRRGAPRARAPRRGRCRCPARRTHRRGARPARCGPRRGTPRPRPRIGTP